jgi:hypothetical protein
MGVFSDRTSMDRILFALRITRDTAVIGVLEMLLLKRPGRLEAGPSRINHLLAGKIQGILPISPVGSSQRVQNIGRITVCYERIPGALEQGNFGSHQGIELGNQVLSGKELSLALFGICAKRK